MCYSLIGHNNKSISCAQSRAGICLTVLKWSGESLYPGALPPLLENVRTAYLRYSPDPTNSLRVSEDFRNTGNSSSQSHFYTARLPCCNVLHNKSSYWLETRLVAIYHRIDELLPMVTSTQYGKRRWIGPN